MDQKAHAGDDQDHHAAERIEQVTPVSGEVDQGAGRGGRFEPGEPGELHDLVRMALDAPQLEDRAGGKDERQQHHAGADEADELLAGGGVVFAVTMAVVAMRVLRIQAASEEQHDHRPDEREHGDEPDAVEEEHLTSASFQPLQDPYHRRMSISSACTVSLFRNRAIRMPRPTAASAAASVITKIVNTWPLMFCR